MFPSILRSLDTIFKPILDQCRSNRNWDILMLLYCVKIRGKSTYLCLTLVPVSTSGSVLILIPLSFHFVTKLHSERQLQATLIKLTSELGANSNVLALVIK